MPQAYNTNTIVNEHGNTKTDIEINISGFKNPDRVYGYKFNRGYETLKYKPKVSNLYP